MKNGNPVPGKDGNKYVPFEERTGESSVVFFTRDLSEEGLKKIYDRVCSVLTGKVAIKLHTGEAEGLGRVPPGQGDLERSGECRERKGRLSEQHFLPHWGGEPSPY